MIRLIDELPEDATEGVSIHLEEDAESDTRVALSVGPARITASLVQGSFPSYEQLIPADHEVSIEVSVGALSETVRRA